MKFDYVAVCESTSLILDFCPIKVNVSVGLRIFHIYHNTNDKSYNSTLVAFTKLMFQKIFVHQLTIYIVDEYRHA